MPLENSTSGTENHQALPSRRESAQCDGMRAVRIIHQFLKWLWPAVFGAVVASVTAALAASETWDPAKDWTEARFLDTVAIVGNPWAWAIAGVVFLVWLAAFIWSGEVVDRPERTPKPTLKPTRKVSSTNPTYGKIVVGGRATDELGVTIGPLPTAEALNVFEKSASEYIPLDEAGTWLYDNGEPWLRDHLKDPEPFKSITEHAAAFVGEACDEGAGELLASREPGLKPEPMKYKDLHHTGFDAVFGGKPLPVNPMVRRSDLPSILAYYKNPIAPQEPIKVRRDAPFREAIMFAVTGAWGGDPWADGDGQLAAISAALNAARQLASDGAISMWGKSDNYGVWLEIERTYWVSHYVDLLDVLRGETRTRAYNKIGTDPLFIDLMVSRVEFEREWREANA